MTINKKGGKHKHKKRIRNNPDGDNHNPKNIDMPSKKEGTYFAKVIKVLGNKHFKVIVFNNNEDEDKEYTGVLRGSKQMKWKCPRVTLNSYVIVSISEYIKKAQIHWVYKDWETKYPNLPGIDGMR